jgi:NADH:ubiquinone oxidoreductase subunit 5 (subunit L)/multisubunit Na+/H+ antiporter MnhA subunit
MFHGAAAMATHGFTTLPFWLALGGVLTAWLFYLKAPAIPAALDKALKPLRVMLENKYYMDWINENILARAARLLGTGLWKGGDQGLIDGVVINGSARGGRRLRRPGAPGADRPPVLVCAGDGAGHLRLPDLAAVALPGRCAERGRTNRIERKQWVC